MPEENFQERAFREAMDRLDDMMRSDRATIRTNRIPPEPPNRNRPRPIPDIGVEGISGTTTASAAADTFNVTWRASDSYFHYYEPGPPDKIPKMKNITPDEKGKAMNNIVLTDAERSAMRCQSILTDYKNRYVKINSNLRPINFPVVFHQVVTENQEVKMIQFTGIILGYRVNNKRIFDADQARKEAGPKGTIDYLVACVTSATNDKNNHIRFLLSDNVGGGDQASAMNFLKHLKIRVKSAELSSKLFGLGKAKEEMIGKVYDSYSIEYGFSKKMDTDTFYINIQVENKSFKFCMADIDYILPSGKGYNFPQDKSMKVGNLVRVRNNKDCKHIPIGQEMIIRQIKPNKFSKKICKNSQTRQLDMIVGTTPENKDIRIYAKNLKLISNDFTSKSQGPERGNSLQTTGTFQASNAFHTQG